MSISFWNFTLEQPFIIEFAGVEVWSKMIQSLSNHIKKMKGSEGPPQKRDIRYMADNM